MNEKIVKTVLWSDAKELLAALASQNLGRAKNNKPAGFCEFMQAYPSLPIKKIGNFLEDIISRHVLPDVSQKVTFSEDSCLFAAHDVTALDIILRYLRILNSGGKIEALWAFLDRDKKAVIHFVNKGGWYVEAFFSCPEEFSAIHLLKNSRNENLFILVSMMPDLSKLVSRVSLRGNFCLQEYLPREQGDFLSKKGKKHCSSLTKSQTPAHQHSRRDDLL